MRLFLIAAAFVLFACHHPVLAQEVMIVDARVTWYGVYQTGRDTLVRDDSSFTGKRTVSTGIVPPEISSDRILAVLGLRFGFGFSLSGTPADAIAKMQFVRNFPPEGVIDATAGKRHFSEHGEFDIRIGQQGLFVGYLFDREKELVAGTWSLEVWHRDRRLLEKSFTVYKP